MSTFSYAADYGAAGKRTPRVRSSKFGDGYEQRQEDGINSMQEIWDLQFMNREAEVGNAIDAFLTALKGVAPFTWTTPSGVSGSFICKDWTYSLDRGNNVSITARFEQVFDPT